MLSRVQDHSANSRDRWIKTSTTVFVDVLNSSSNQISELSFLQKTLEFHKMRVASVFVTAHVCLCGIIRLLEAKL